MKIDFIYPNSELLKKHIECFSFVQTSQEVEAEYVMYPNVTTILSLSKQTTLQIQNNFVTVKINPQLNEIQSDITGRFLVPLHFRYLGKFDEINIVFKPLGFAYFFPQLYSKIALQNYQLFRPDFADWSNFTKQLFDYETQNKRVKCLENYLLQKFNPPELERFSQVVDCLLNLEETRSIREISFEAGFHQKKLERICLNHLGCSAATFRRIVRFRHSIKLRLAENKAKDFTDISHQSNFSDQPYFNKEFRKLSEMSPKEFFKATWKIPKHNIVLKVL